MKRTYKDKCTIHWHESWTQLRDSQGDKVGLWGLRQSDSHGKCTWCQSIFRFDGKGSHAFLDHAKSKKHKFNSDGQQGRMMNQRSVLNTQPEEEWGEEDDISSNLGEAEEDADSPGVVSGEEVGRSGWPQTGGHQDYATSIRLASEDKNKRAIQEREVQEKLRVHMGKKHRGIGN